MEKNLYQILIEKSERMMLTAIEYYHLQEYQLVTFYKNASIECKRKALNLNVC